MFSQKENKTAEAVGGSGVNDVIRIDTENAKLTRKRLISVGWVYFVFHASAVKCCSRQPVTTMAISLTGTSLLVGTETGHINIYDILSHQLLRTISSHKGMSITYLTTMLKPVDLIGHVSLSLNVRNMLDAKDVIPVKPVMPFQRMKDAKLRDVHEVTMMLPVQNSVCVLDLSKADL